MQELNLPTYSFKFKDDPAGYIRIFDAIRKKYVVLTPEEWVRQNFVQFLAIDKKYPVSLIALEISLKYNQLQKRADVLVYSKQGKPFLMVECKAPEVKVTQAVFHQIAMYNMTFKVEYLVVTNGLDHFCCKMDYEAGTYRFLQMIPDFE
ncbi:MAG: restriction endonuclease subunit [Bacteroidetes bacterium]|nr:restriction endonuclease subunit [Bacteroidota bacterium]